LFNSSNIGIQEKAFQGLALPPSNFIKDDAKKYFLKILPNSATQLPPL
jgi:hypothetical protein